MQLKTFFFILIILCFGSGCNSDDETPIPTILKELEGTWQFELGALDLIEVESWSDASMMIDILSDSSIRVTCINQPSNRLNIWPSESILILKEPIKFGQFRRDDGIDVNMFLNDSLRINMHPPRKWSYDNECDPPDTNGFQCSDEGQWLYILKVKE